MPNFHQNQNNIYGKLAAWLLPGRDDNGRIRDLLSVDSVNIKEITGSAAVWLLLMNLLVWVHDETTSQIISLPIDVLLTSGIMYIMLHFFAPRFLSGNRVFVFILFLLGIGALTYPIYYYVQYITGAPLLPGQRGDVLSVSISCSANVFCATGLLLLNKTVAVRYSIIHAENEYAEKKYELIKTQINPDFYFKSIVNLHHFAQKNKKDLPQAIIELAQIMEYLFYQSQKGSIPLQTELAFLENYFSFYNKTYPNVQINTRITTCIQDQTVEELVIAPTILFEFAETQLRKASDMKSVQFECWISPHILHADIKVVAADQMPATVFGLDKFSHKMTTTYPNTILYLSSTSNCDVTSTWLIIKL